MTVVLLWGWGDGRAHAPPLGGHWRHHATKTILGRVVALPRTPSQPSDNNLGMQ